MKKIEAIIRKTKFEDVKDALLEADIEWFSYYDVRGIGKSRQARIYRGVLYDTSSIERILISIVVRDKNVEKTVQAIIKAAQTGEIGDGRIFVIPIEDAIRIRTGERGDIALYNAEQKCFEQFYHRVFLLKFLFRFSYVILYLTTTYAIPQANKRKCHKKVILCSRLTCHSECTVVYYKCIVMIDRKVFSWNISPTHPRTVKVAHFDLYSILDSEALFEIGFDEYLDGSRIVLIEWSENAADVLPEAYKTVHIAYGDADNDRRITIGEVTV